jgi:hypothetical protein
MAIKKIEPVSERSKIDYARMQGNYPLAREKLDRYHEVSLPEIGIDWNPTTFMRGSHHCIDFCLPNEYVASSTLVGHIKNGGRDQPTIEVVDSDHLVGCASMTSDYIIRSLSEGVSLLAKLEILEDTELLPGGHTLVTHKGNNTHPRSPFNGTEDKRMKEFAQELQEKGTGLCVARINKQFGDYVVVRTEQGWYIAYNRDYGEAPYVVTDLNTLKQDKSSARKSGDVIWFRRDSRGDWVNRLRGFL